MEVILLERVAKLGQMGETVRVKDGFARNFLLPKGKALRATKANKERYEDMRKDLEAKNLENRGEAAESRRQAERQDLCRDPPGFRIRPALWLGVRARCCRPRHRRRLRGLAQPGRAQRADQDHRPAQGRDRAASRGRGQCHGHRRAQCRRSRARSSAARTSRSGARMPRSSASMAAAAAEAFFDPEARDDEESADEASEPAEKA